VSCFWDFTEGCWFKTLVGLLNMSYSPDIWTGIMLVNQMSVPSFCDVLALSFDSLPQFLGSLSTPYSFSYSWYLLLCY
jgi:hypothetical protein